MGRAARRMAVVIAGAVLAVLSLGATSASAATVTWVPTEGVGAWSDGANWSGGAVPSSVDDVVIPTEVVVTDLPAAATVRSLTLGDADGQNGPLLHQEVGDAELSVTAASTIHAGSFRSIVLHALAPLSVGGTEWRTIGFEGGGLHALGGLRLDVDEVELLGAALVVDGALTSDRADMSLAGTGTYRQIAGVVQPQLRVSGGIHTRLGGSDAADRTPVRLGGAENSLDGPVTITGGLVTFGGPMYFGTPVTVTGGSTEIDGGYASASMHVADGELHLNRWRSGAALVVDGTGRVRITSGQIGGAATVSGADAQLELAGSGEELRTYLAAELHTAAGGVVTIDGETSIDGGELAGPLTGTIRMTVGSRLLLEDRVRLGNGLDIDGAPGSVVQITDQGDVTVDIGAAGEVRVGPRLEIVRFFVVLSGRVEVDHVVNDGNVMIADGVLTAETFTQTRNGLTFIEFGSGAAGSAGTAANLVVQGLAALDGGLIYRRATSFTRQPALAQRYELVRWATSTGTYAWLENDRTEPLDAAFLPPETTPAGVSVVMRGSTPHDDGVITPQPPVTSQPPVVPPQPPTATPPKLLRLIGNARANVLTGSARNDTMYGMGGNDRLRGGGGNDRIDGGAGNDALDGGTGRDVISGGAGSDVITSRDRLHIDRVSCGPGRDRVVADHRDIVSRDCERVVRR